MKKTILLFTLALCSMALNAQIFTEKIVYDKFDDIVSQKQIKSLISYVPDESIITFEEKGTDPQKYYLFKWCKELSSGSKDNIVNLIDNIYGYQDTWYAMREQDMEEFRKIAPAIQNGEEKVDSKIMEKYWLFITHRVVVTQFSKSFINEFWWIKNEYTGSREIYAR